MYLKLSIFLKKLKPGGSVILTTPSSRVFKPMLFSKLLNDNKDHEYKCSL